MSLAAVSLVGLALFFWPLLGGGIPPEIPALAVTVASLAALGLMEIGARRLDSGRLALLAVLAAIDAGLRLAVVNGIAGFSPIFFLVLMAGYAFGPSYGFLVGAFSLLVSGLVTGGIGPWLPYEAFAAGWVGVAAGAAAWCVNRVRARRAAPSSPGRLGSREAPAGAASIPRADRRPAWIPRRLDIGALVLVAIVTGFAYGALTDIWDWATFYRGVETIGWTPGMSPPEALDRFGRFYLVTSLAWDAFRAAGDSLAVLALGTPVLMALGRLRARLGFEIVPPPVPAGGRPTPMPGGGLRPSDQFAGRS